LFLFNSKTGYLSHHYLKKSHVSPFCCGSIHWFSVSMPALLVTPLGWQINFLGPNTSMTLIIQHQFIWKPPLKLTYLLIAIILLSVSAFHKISVEERIKTIYKLFW
jgi:hypothetical protein